MVSQNDYDKLLNDYSNLQLRVTRFSYIEQQLINTRDELDRELLLYKRLNKFNKEALKDMAEVEFVELVADSIIDIFEIEMTDKGKWSTPKRINNKTINSTFFDGSATMTEDGSTMYFVSDRKGEKSSTDIYVVEKVGKKWGEAKPLPIGSVNTVGRETTPFVTGDGRYLFYSSDGLPGMGGLDVYVVENLGGGQWGIPVHLGPSINTVNNDTHFQYFKELNKAVMASFEIVGQKASMDLYEVDMTGYQFPENSK
jgi:Tol biopolymer transport system component